VPRELKVPVARKVTKASKARRDSRVLSARKAFRAHREIKASAARKASRDFKASREQAHKVLRASRDSKERLVPEAFSDR
jgi:hypothetical protein